MPTYKATFTFAGRDYGWTESWYLPSRATSTAALDDCGLYGIVRAGLLGSSAELKRVRVCDANFFGQADIADVDDVATFKDLGIQPSDWDDPQLANWECDYRNTAILARGMAGDDVNAGLYRRSITLRGIPDAWCAFNVIGEDQVGGGDQAALNLWNQKWAAYKNLLKSANFCIRAIDKKQTGPDATHPSYAIPQTVAGAPPVPGITVGADGKFQINGSVGAPDISDNSQVLIKRVNKLYVTYADGTRFKVKGLGGRRLVYNVTASSFQIDLKPVQLGIAPGYTLSYGGGAVVLKQVFNFFPVTKVIVEGFASRKTGLPFDRSRGRR